MYNQFFKPVVNYFKMLTRILKDSKREDERKVELEKIDKQIEKLRSVKLDTSLLKDYCDANY